MNKNKELNVAFYEAVKEQKNINEILTMIKKGVDVNWKPSRKRSSALINAISGCADFRYALVDTLVKNGADVNQKDVYGDTPLHHAARLGDLHLCLLLVDLGAVSVKNKDGDKPYMLFKNYPLGRSALKEITE